MASGPITDRCVMKKPDLFNVLLILGLAALVLVLIL
jgi:hypothetical protein